jgi:alpha-beta hydrolase superfamily lysophospholipase
LRDVSILASDRITLRAWYIRPADANGNAVILLHGVGDNRLGVYGYGDWLVRNHYSVLLPDSRAHGASGGEIASYGVKESGDIHSWVSWLIENEHPHCIFGFGESMGAAQLLQSLPKEPRFCAVIAESPFKSFREVAYARFGRPFHAGPWLGRTFFWPTVEVGFLYVHLRFGLDMETATPEGAVAATSVPVFLIHGSTTETYRLISPKTWKHRTRPRSFCGGLRALLTAEHMEFRRRNSNGWCLPGFHRTLRDPTHELFLAAVITLRSLCVLCG